MLSSTRSAGKLQIKFQGKSLWDILTNYASIDFLWLIITTVLALIGRTAFLIHWTCWIAYPFYLTPNGHATRCTQVLKYGRSSSRLLEAQLHCSCYRIPRLSQCGYHILDSVYKRGKVTWKRWGSFAIAVKEHSDTSWRGCQRQTYSWKPIMRGRPNLSAVSSMYNVLIHSNCICYCRMTTLITIFDRSNN